MLNPPQNQPSGAIKLFNALLSSLITLLHQLVLLLIDPLAKIFECIGHALLRCVVLLHKLAFTRLKALVLQVQIVNLLADLICQFLHRTDKLRVGLPQECHVMAAMATMDNTLRTDRWAITIEAVVGDLELRIILAHLTDLPIGLVNGLMVVVNVVSVVLMQALIVLHSWCTSTSQLVGSVWMVLAATTLRHLSPSSEITGSGLRHVVALSTTIGRVERRLLICVSSIF